MESRIWPCAACDQLCTFVQPPCADGHTDDGGDCPEWACVDCGTALILEHPAPAAVAERISRVA